jgi:predicted Zn-dependent peptidase
MIRALLAPLALAALLAPMPAHAADAGSGTLPQGVQYMLFPDPTLASGAVDLWFRAPSAGYDNAQPGLCRIAATAAAAATLESGKSLVSLVRDLGGHIAINVYPDIVGVTISAPAGAMRKVVAAASAAYFAPSLDADALKTARRDAAVLTAEHQYSSDAIVHDRLFAEIFSGGPAHVAPLGANVEAITTVSLDDVRAFAKRAFRSANATLSLAGNIGDDALAAVTAGAPGSPDAPFDSTVAPSPASDSAIAGAVSGDGIAWTGPPIADERAATAMDFISDYLFRDPTGIVNATLPPLGDTYVLGQFITLHDPGVMLVTMSGDGDAALQKRVLDAVAALQTPMDAKRFSAALNAFLYHLASDTQTPVEQADNLGWYSAEGSPGYAPSHVGGTYWKAALSLDPAYVASVAQRYLTHPVVVHLHATSSKESSS